MAEIPEPERKEASQESPAWSVLAGEFDPSDPKLNSILVARTVDSFWFNPIHSDNRRRMHATELFVTSL